MADTVKMQFPAKREYLKAIRLAVAGIACNSAYDVDEIEDLKTCVAESCILFLCRQKKRNTGNRSGLRRPRICYGARGRAADRMRRMY